MTNTDEITNLKRENEQLREALKQRDHVIEHMGARIEQLMGRIAELEARVRKDSQNSSKPPSSDGLRRRPRTHQPRGQKSSGGQIGHEGHALERVATPDHQVHLYPITCAHGGEVLQPTDGHERERRQVFEMPQVQLFVTEYVQHEVRCPQCSHTTTGCFPPEATSLAQYGPNLRAWAVYLRMQHFVSVERTSEVIHALTGADLSEGTILAWEQQVSQVLEPALEEVRQALSHATVIHADETGFRLGNLLHWVHVHCTPALTLLSWHCRDGLAGSVAYLPRNCAA